MKGGKKKEKKKSKKREKGRRGLEETRRQVRRRRLKNVKGREMSAWAGGQGGPSPRPERQIDSWFCRIPPNTD